LAFDQNGNLLALLNDRDGNGVINHPSDGVAMAKIATTPTGGFVRVSNPTANGSLPVIITGPITNNFTGLAVNGGTIYAVQSVGSTEELDTLAVAGAGNA